VKKRTKILLVILLFILCTGCTKSLKDGKEVVINPATGQTLTANILCKPDNIKIVDEKNKLTLYDMYEKHNDKLDVKLDKLPDCNKFTPNKIEYKGLWESIFIKPLAWIILKLGNLISNMGLSVMIIGLLIRILMMPIQIKTVKQSENMKKMQPEMAKIEKKYKNKTDNDSLMAKSQETMMLYKKFNINPVSSCLLAFIQLPLFFAFLEAINRVPAIFEESLFSLQLGTTPLVGIKSGNYLYLILIVLIIVTTYLSFKSNMANTGSSEQQQQMKFMTTFMLIFISIASFSLPTAIALYWVVTNGFSVLQTLIFKKRR
jgi:YidC/Oxa1 family membrane protein insertase